MSVIPDDICGVCYHPKSDRGKCQHPDCPVCPKCYDTQILHAQNWSENWIKKRGNPYHSVRCDCVKKPNGHVILERELKAKQKN